MRTLFFFKEKNGPFFPDGRLRGFTSLSLSAREVLILISDRNPNYKNHETGTTKP